MFFTKIKSVLFAFLAVLILSCSKGGSDPNPPTPPAEENLSIGVDPDPGAETAKTLGSSYDFKVLIKSKMPEKGVEGTVTFRKEFDNSLISTQNISGTASPINVTISNIVLNEVGIVTIELKSKSKPANTASKTFKLARK
ncbi:hypothetical protein [Terrimonas alba]|jgi:hypothetical protein|uniref:hypothetical protein n=1 Tax=Terrimonas alba TaxID=3349636 RepID=UPI0035F315B8